MDNKTEEMTTQTQTQTHWTGLPRCVLYQGLSGGLDGREPAQAHCGVTLPEEVSGDENIRTMMKRSLVAPPDMMAAVQALYGEDKVYEAECKESFSFTFKKGRRKDFVISPTGPSGREIDWMVSRAQPSHVHTRSGSMVDLGRRGSLELTNGAIHCKTWLPDDVLEGIRRRLFPHVRSLRPRFEKVVIYTDNGFVGPHRDAPQWPTHVGTLLFIPVMTYGGGHLLVEGRPRARNGSAYVAFPCSALHHVLPVVGGCRLAVVFSLWARGVTETAAVVRRWQAELSPVLRDLATAALWTHPLRTEKRQATAVVIRLSGQYTLEQASSPTCANCFNGPDAALYASVRELCFRKPSVVPVQLGTYHYGSENYCWISRWTHFDAGCQCEKEDTEIPHPNLLDPSRALLVGFEDTGPLTPTGSTPFYDAGTSLSTYRACAIAFPTAALLRGTALRAFLLASYRGRGDTILFRLRAELRDLWVLLGSSYFS
jgi:hypothetical protein